jgi:TIR domain-containing protein
MSGMIFINYRRDDAPADARGIRDSLASKFGKTRVFMDISDLVPGRRFDQALDAALKECKLLIAVIGPRWTEITKQRAVSGERDLVISEVGAALKRNIPIIPACVGRMQNMPPMPDASELPEGIRDLASFHKIDIAHETYARDIDGLAAAIRALNVIDSESAHYRYFWIGAGAAAIAVIGALAVMAPHFGFSGTCSVAGQWSLKQDNGVPVDVDLAQAPNGSLTGKAKSRDAAGNVTGEGNVGGEISGRKLHFAIAWSGRDHQTGDYKGIVGADSQLTGTTSDVNKPDNTATWRSTGRTFECTWLARTDTAAGTAQAWMIQLS